MTSLLPFPELQFLDNDGNPLALGTVATYTPGTLSPKITWSDPLAETENTNPVVLNAAGRAIFYGSGSYRFVVKNALGALIYDQVTASTLAESVISSVMLPVVGAATLQSFRDLSGTTAAINAAVSAVSLLVGPVGPTSTVPGPQGPTGPQGEQGVQGLPGNSGGAGSASNYTPGAIGTYLFLFSVIPADTAGYTVGDLLTSIPVGYGSTQPTYSGTWQCMGPHSDGTGTTEGYQLGSLWLRIA